VPTSFERIGHQIVDAMGTGGNMSSLYKSLLLGLSIAVLCIFPAYGDDVVECDEVIWEEQILLHFDGIEEACQEVVIRDGNRYVRFEVKFVRATVEGDVYVRMKLRDGTRVERVFPAPKDLSVASASGKTDFAMRDLTRGDVLDVYIPLSRVVAAMPSR
jgi:hypothetical protein